MSKSLHLMTKKSEICEKAHLESDFLYLHKIKVLKALVALVHFMENFDTISVDLKGRQYSLPVFRLLTGKFIF